MTAAKSHRSYLLLAAAAPRERSAVLMFVELLGGGAVGMLLGLGVAFAVVMIALLIGVQLGFAPGWILAATQASAPPALGGRALGSYLFELALGLCLPAFAWGFVRFSALSSGRPFRTFVTTAPAFRWRLAIAGFLAYVPILAVALAANGIDGPGTGPAPLFWPNADMLQRLLYAGGALVFLALAAWAEEVVFRGWLLQRAALLIPSIPVALMLSAALFSAAHMDPRPDAFIARFIMGLVWGWIALRTGGIEFSVGAHLANNLLICLFIEPLTLAQPVWAPFDIGGVIIEAFSGAALIVSLLCIQKTPRLRPLFAQTP